MKLARQPVCCSVQYLQLTFVSCMSSWSLLTNCSTIAQKSDVCFTDGLTTTQPCAPYTPGSVDMASQLIATKTFGGDGQEGGLCTLRSSESACNRGLTCTSMPVSKAISAIVTLAQVSIMPARQCSTYADHGELHLGVSMAPSMPPSAPRPA